MSFTIVGASWIVQTPETKGLHDEADFLVLDNTRLSMTKHLVCESSYRLQMKVVDNKVVFLFKFPKLIVVDSIKLSIKNSCR